MSAPPLRPCPLPVLSYSRRTDTNERYTQDLTIDLIGGTLHLYQCPQIEGPFAASPAAAAAAAAADEGSIY